MFALFAVLIFENRKQTAIFEIKSEKKNENKTFSQTKRAIARY